MTNSKFDRDLLHAGLIIPNNHVVCVEPQIYSTGQLSVTEPGLYAFEIPTEGESNV